MTGTMDAQDFQTRLRRLDQLIDKARGLADPATQAYLRDVVQAILDLHGTGLKHIVAHVESAGEAGAAALAACARDGVAGGLLLLHGLHPMDLEARVRQALDQVRPVLRSHGGNVELIGVDDGIIRLRLLGSCHGCASSALTLKHTIEQAVLGWAPDAEGLEVEGGVVDEPLTTPDGRPLVVLSAS